MKKTLNIAVAVLVALSVSACARTGVVLPPPPSAIAETTTMDERTSLAIEVLYRGLGGLLEAAVDGGRLKGTAAERADRIDGKLAFYVGMARAAYDAGNADSYAEALKRARPLADQLRRILAERP